MYSGNPLNRMDVAGALRQYAKRPLQLSTLSQAQADVAASAVGLTAPAPMQVVEEGKYGDATVLPVIFSAAGDLLVLPRPKARRALLIIQNPSTALQSIFYSFDAAASLTSGIEITPGGAQQFDVVVPQNDLHIYVQAAQVVQVLFINNNPD